MYTLNGWWFLSSGGSYPPVFMVATRMLSKTTGTEYGCDHDRCPYCTLKKWDAKGMRDHVMFALTWHTQ